MLSENSMAGESPHFDCSSAPSAGLGKKDSEQPARVETIALSHGSVLETLQVAKVGADRVMLILREPFVGLRITHNPQIEARFLTILVLVAHSWTV